MKDGADMPSTAMLAAGAAVLISAVVACYPRLLNGPCIFLQCV